MATENRCDGCRHWRRIDKGDLTDYEAKPPYVSDEVDESDPSFVAIGECRRYPPQIIEAIMVDTAAVIQKNHRINLSLTSPAITLRGSCWPLTWEADSCGEWTA